MKNFIFFSLLFISSICSADQTPAPLTAGDKIQDISITPVLGSSINLDLKFVDEKGNDVKLRDFLATDKPIILAPVYYRCPSLCGVVTQGTIALVNDLQVTLGDEYNIVFVSFNPLETPEVASAKSKSVYKALKNPEAGVKGWRFLTGKQEEIASLLQSLQFRVKKDGDEYVHASAIFIITPEGKISQYFTGVLYPPFDVKLSLVEASHGKIGNILHQAMLYCFSFDPLKGKYTLAAYTTMRVGGILTLIGIFVLWYVMTRKKS